MKVQVALVNSTSGELDKVTVEVKDDSDCAREVLAAVQRQKWMLATGDSIQILGESH